ncbi:MAG: hypothetical protein KBT01_09205 [Clostridiales bacterium]|nr:hypothetical protein [Candidatus Blautia equi]
MYFEELLQEKEETGAVKKLVSFIIKRMEKGTPIAEIAEWLEESEEYITRIYDVISKYAPDYDLDKIVDELTAKNS